METIFQVSSWLTMPFWVLMILAPHWGWTRRIMATMWPIVPAALLYSVLVLPVLPELLGDLANPALEPIARLLGTPEGATIGWIHFLAFDLFVGRWAYLDSRARGMSAWLASPVLFVILMFGPLGFLVYLGVRLVGKGRDARAAELSAAISSAVRSVWAFNRPITLAILLHVALIPIVLAAAVVDPKMIMGAPGWIKPLKFAISNVAYLATFAWLLTLVRGRLLLVQTAATVTGVALIVESALILLQVVRGVASHFNAATAFDATVFGIMGLFILLVGIFNLIVAVLLLFQRPENRVNQVLAAGVRLGVIVSLVGMMIGVLMSSGPTPEQQAMLERGEQPSMIGADSVGAADGGPGLPFVGWSTEGGDLRVGHFLGIHGMQALPLLALVLCRPGIRRRYSEGRRVALVWIGAAGYIGLTVILTWQALRGQPLIAPDALTLGALGLLAAVVGVAAGAVLMGIERGEEAMAAV